MIAAIEPADDALLDALERAAFGYFAADWDCIGGMPADNSRPGAPISIAVVGFALSVYPIAVERGWMTRADALARSLAALRFFAASEQGGAPDATGCNGFYYHFLDRATGRRVWRSELSMVDTALLIAGALVAQRYFGSADADETALRALVDGLYGRVDWRWAQNGGATIMQGWKPECGFLHYGWEGYNEAIVLYVLALGSLSHPLDESCYLGWTATYQWENIYGHEFLYGGPLFMHQFSHAWIDFRGIRDEFMREKRCDYFENSRRATLVQREYARRNPHEFDGYDERTWGLTACDGPGTWRQRFAATDGIFSATRHAASPMVPMTARSPGGAPWHRCRSHPKLRWTLRAACATAIRRCSTASAMRAASIPHSRATAPPGLRRGCSASTRGSLR